MKCTGVKDHVAQQLIRMTQFDVNNLRKDANFIEEAIAFSNVAKKKSFEMLETQALNKQTKRMKNLRYFLKKKRNVLFKQTPLNMSFTRNKLNTTSLESDASSHAKFILWAVELVFLKAPNYLKSSLDSVDCYERIAEVVLNNESMIHEETTLQSFITAHHLKENYYSQEFNSFITERDSEDILLKCKVFLKKG